MPSFDFTPPNTGSTLSTMAPNSVRKLWSQGLLMAENNADFFSSLESASNKALIRVKTDTAKGKGQKITFTNMSGFYDEPHHGDEMFESPDDFEEIQIGDFELTVDWIRHATSTNERMEEVMGMRGEIESGLNVQLGEWLGRQKSEKLFAEFMLHLNTENVLYAGGKTLDTLGSADTLAWDEIVNMGYAMKPLGGLPANIAAAGSKAPIWSQLVIPTEAAMLSLKLDADYKQVQREAGVRGGSNELFKGGVVDIDGHSIMPYNPIDHDGIGAIGSFLNPKAQLGTAITAGTGTFDITGGGNATLTMTITPVGNYSGTVTYSCGNLPQYTACAFNPQGGVALNGTNTPQTVTLTVYTLGPANTSSLLWLPALALGLLLMLRRRKLRVPAMLAGVLLLAGMLGLSGCAPVHYYTPTGTNSISINAVGVATAGSGSSNVNQSATLTLITN